MAIIDFDSLIERLIPYSEEQSKEKFLHLITNTYPELKEDLNRKLNEDNEWTRKVREGKDVYFNIYDSHWKFSKKCPKRKIMLDYIESSRDEKKLVIKLDIF